MTWPQPFEGVRGTEHGSWLLSLDERAIAHREFLIEMAHHLSTATLVGNPAPVVRRMNNRLRAPEPGDLVVTTEVMHGRRDPDDRLKGFGIFLAGRKEWAESDAAWQLFCESEIAAIRASYGYTDEANTLIAQVSTGEDRMTDTVFYIQYGQDPGDICRWHNSEAIVLPVDTATFSADAAASREETADGRTRATFTRESLIGGLADSGFHLKGDAPVAGWLPDNGQLVTLRIEDGEAAITDVRDIPRASVTS